MGVPFPIRKGSWVYLTKNERKISDAISGYVLEHMLTRKSKRSYVPITHLQRFLKEKYGTGEQTTNKIVWMMIAARMLKIKQFGRNRLLLI